MYPAAPGIIGHHNGPDPCFEFLEGTAGHLTDPLYLMTVSEKYIRVFQNCFQVLAVIGYKILPRIKGHKVCLLCYPCIKGAFRSRKMHKINLRRFQLFQKSRCTPVEISALIVFSVSKDESLCNFLTFAPIS